MSLRLCCLVAALTGSAVLVGCENKPSPPLGPSNLDSVPAAVVGEQAPLAAKAEAQHVVTIFDACDPETFNAALGAGMCIRAGGVQFPKFLEQLAQHHSVGAWHFAPPNVTMKVGELLVATNRGGETHTFTEVEEFGGGRVAQLNELTGLTEVAPECTRLTPGDFLAPGASSSEEEEESGIAKYQCCIHPWMRTQVRVKEK
jgi:hypothetical protein